MLFRYREEVSAFQIGILTEEMAVLHIPVLSVSSAVDVILANHVRYRIFPKSWVHRPPYTHISLRRTDFVIARKWYPEFELLTPKSCHLENPPPLHRQPIPPILTQF